MLKRLFTLDVGQRVGQCRAALMELGSGREPALMVAYCADFDVDPYPEMFFFPTDTYKLMALSLEGEALWRRDLGPGVVPGIWFTPMLPADLDGDGVDEIYFVGNKDPQHPLSVNQRALERLDGRTGETTGQWPWPRFPQGESPSHTWRNFLLAGQVRGNGVLVSGQGTYGNMHLQGWNGDLSRRWEVEISAREPGARGSHMTPVVDWDGDGSDEFFWGERLLKMDTGEEVFCADRESYDGHSDIIQPVLDWETGKWRVFTCRETAEANLNFPERQREPIAPRVAMFDSGGQRIWGNLDRGHMDMGFVARVGPDREPVASAVRIGKKTCGPDGRFHTEIEDFFYDARDGRRIDVGWSGYRALPVDIDGDGRHEFVRGAPSGDGDVWDFQGQDLGSLGGAVAYFGKLTDHAGEQMLSYSEDGRLQLWAWEGGEDSVEARARYAHPYYRTNAKLMGTGYNFVNRGGL